MHTLHLFFFVLPLILSPPLSVSIPPTSLNKHSSLSVGDVLRSPNGKFSAGFYCIGANAYYFAIWFNRPSRGSMVWTANRDFPVNREGTKLLLLKTGNLVLKDADETVVWSSHTVSIYSMQLDLYDTGNLVLHDINGYKLWQSFDSPTDTLLPQQPLTRYTHLVSSRSQTNFSSGYYKLFFDIDNVLRLAFDGPETSSLYWPDPTLLPSQAKRTRYNDSRTAVFDNKGNFTSSDQAEFWSLDFGSGPQRRLTLDFDGNLRLYSFEEATDAWSVTWQAMQEPCRIHGACGPNGLCTYHPRFGRKCLCPPRFKKKNQTDWRYGCEPEFKLSCKKNEIGFVELYHVEFYGYDFQVLQNQTLEMCKNACLGLCNCKGFLYQPMEKDRVYNCYPKRELRNGQRSPNFNGTLYLKVPKPDISSYYKESLEELQQNCSDQLIEHLNRTYHKYGGNGSLNILLGCACVIGFVEIVSFSLACIFLHRSYRNSDALAEGYLVIAPGFRRFTYIELEMATNNFSEEIGREERGTVYKGVLPDQRTSAIKRLNEANQKEEEFLAEVGAIGRLNHMNLIDMWGYCTEGNHRLLVYEYMENGSLDNKLLSNSLDWDKRFGIAIGTAKGLAYLHEECLEWVLHCDVKPQNILLDSNYQPKVADFGLSKILNQAAGASDSTVRGYWGYMAPEWVLNLPITSKVDVYSYGIVMLEMVTGKNPTAMVFHAVTSSGEVEHQSLVAWVREAKDRATTTVSWLKEIADPVLENKYDISKIETLVRVALQCVEEDKDARPSMSQVVEMLSHHGSDH